MLTGKRGMLITCHGNPKDFYDSIGMYNALNLTSDNGIFDFCGIDVVAHQYFDSVPSSTEEQRKQMLVQVEKLAAKLV
jgi:NAD(P)H dehydrogenase (quinone)